MESVGSQLRQARSRLGLTLEQVSARTRICTKNLEALENDDLSHISSPFFYRSFVRQFAEQLNLDYASMAPAVQDAVSAIPEPLIPGQALPGQAEQSHPKVPALPLGRPRSMRWLSPLLSLSVMLVGFSGFYALWQNTRSNSRHSVASRIGALLPNALSPHTQTAAPKAPPQTVSPAAPAPLESNAQPVQPTPAEAPFRVELSALERTWLSIVADGRPTFSGILQAAETKILEGHDNARIRTGNAGGISMVFNGKPIGILGRRGQVRTVVFTKDNYEVLQPPPHLALTRFNLNAE
jgi:cytoskeleton protein RodZ